MAIEGTTGFVLFVEFVTFVLFAFTLLILFGILLSFTVAVVAVTGAVAVVALDGCALFDSSKEINGFIADLFAIDASAEFVAELD